MATTRQRRVQANHLPEMQPEADDRIYTEEDYAVPGSTPDEWGTEPQVYPSASWTGATFMPDEAFEPDEEEELPEPSWTENFPGAQEEYASRFSSSFDTADDLDPLAEDLLTEEEQRELKQSRWQLIAGLADFAGVIVGTAAILVLVMLLISLINWLVNDVSQSFILLQKHL